MNDFTLQELIDLLIIIKESIDNSTQPESIFLIADKIESMIDNYCDHKESEMDCDGGISLICTECGYTIMDI